VNKEVKNIPMDGIVEQLIPTRTATSYLHRSSVPHRLLDETILFAGLSLFRGFAAATASAIDDTADR